MKNKKKKFRENETRENIIQPGKVLYDEIKGNWHDKYFFNKGPITLELACGWGQYTLGLAKKFPQQNFIGVDIKGDRLWKGSTLALEDGLGNAAFLRTRIELLDNFFVDNEVDNMWLMFPDPRPRKRDAKRRITSPRFLDLYKQLLRPGGLLMLKTDNEMLFEYSLEVLKERSDIEDLVYTRDLYSSELEGECHDIRTKYEEIFTAEGHNIHYLRFTFKA